MLWGKSGDTEECLHLMREGVLTGALAWEHGESISFPMNASKTWCPLESELQSKLSVSKQKDLRIYNTKDIKLELHLDPSTAIFSITCTYINIYRQNLHI